MTIIEARKKYNSLGYNAAEFKEWAKRQDIQGFDESFDGSLAVIYFKDFTAIITTNHLHFV